MNFPEPPEEDSPDLTDAEIQQAVLTTDSSDLAQKVAAVIKANNLRVALEAHELRKRKPHVYWRVRFVGGPTLVFQVDWLQSR